MAARYQVKLKDTSGALLAVLTDWRSLYYRKAVNKPGNHMLLLDGESDTPALFVLDGQVEVWRRDLENGIDWQLDYEGFHRTSVWQSTAEGLSLFFSYGAGYAGLLARRLVLYYSRSAGAKKSGPGETVIKDYIDENAGPGATSPPRLLASGVTSGLTIEADGGAGTTWSGSKTWQNLLEAIQDIADATGVDFGVVGIGSGTFEFRAKASPWGSDRTTTGLDPATGLNAAGNPPVVFALEFGNMRAPVYSLNRGQEVTAAIVLGIGTGEDRANLQRTDAAALAASPWNRREASRNVNDTDDVADMESEGDGFLETAQARESFDFEVIQTPATLYGRDYFLGDLVTARYKGFERNKKIMAVDVTVNENGESIAVELADVP